MLENRRNNQ